MKEKMIYTPVYLPRDIYAKLRKRYNQDNISMAHQIREALIKHVREAEAYTEGGAHYSIPLQGSLWDAMIGTDDTANSSLFHDNYIYLSDWDPEEN